MQRKVDSATSAVVLKQSEIDAKTRNAAKFDQRPAEPRYDCSSILVKYLFTLINFFRSVTVVANELNEISRTMARRESQCDNIEAITEQYTALVAKYKSVSRMFDFCRNCLFIFCLGC